MIIAKAVGKSHPNPIDASGKKFKFNPGINNSIEKTKEVYTPNLPAFILVCLCSKAKTIIVIETGYKRFNIGDEKTTILSTPSKATAKLTIDIAKTLNL